MRSWLAALVLVLGCGGKLAYSDASTGPEGLSGAPACPRGTVAGATCDPSAPDCLAADGCNPCACAFGVWLCGVRVCPVDAGIGCPGATPATGDTCGAPGAVCDYGTGCAGAHCVCAGTHWTCDAVVCVDGGP